MQYMPFNVDFDKDIWMDSFLDEEEFISFLVSSSV